MIVNSDVTFREMYFAAQNVVGFSVFMLQAKVKFAYWGVFPVKPFYMFHIYFKYDL